MAETIEPGQLDTPFAVKEIHRILGDAIPSRSIFEPFRPQKEWYSRPWSMDGLHGVNHETRVMIAQEILSRLLIKTQGLSINQEALRWAAATHDVRRIDDGYDFQHGVRAADWMVQYFSDHMDPQTLQTAAYIDRWHVTPDNRIPNITVELAIFKDADGLDRARLGDLDPRFLRHNKSRMLLVQPIDTLYQLSSHKQWRENGALFDCVLDAAEEIGLIHS